MNSKPAKLWTGLLRAAIGAAGLICLSTTATAQSQSLRQAADARGMDVGLYVDYWRTAPRNPNYDANYVKNLDEVGGKQFDIVTMGTYQISTNPSEGNWDFTETDEVAKYAGRHGMKIHGHPLVYGQDNVLPSWVKDAAGRGDWAKVRQAMEQQIDVLVNHNRDRIAVWDVVNEAVEWDGSKWTYRPSPFLSAYTQNGEPGHLYIDTAFWRASIGDPNAKLIYNDFDILEQNGKSDYIYDMIKGMLERGVPIDGIGFQTHLEADGRDTTWVPGPFNVGSARKNMKRFADLGLEIYITELDMYMNDTSAAQLEIQAQMFARVTLLCNQEPACKTVQFWGLNDKYTWLDDIESGAKTYPLLFDINNKIKPAFWAVRWALQQ